MFNKVTKSIQYGAHTLTLETGEISRQADAAVLVSCLLYTSRCV